MRGQIRFIASVVAVSAVSLAVAGGSAPLQAAVVPSGRVCVAAAVGGPRDLAVVNVTPVDAVGPGNGQVMSSDVTDPPAVSNVNFAPGTVDPNVAVVPIGADGRICYANSSNATVEVVLDQLTALRADAYTMPHGYPARVIDTRILVNGPALGPSAERCVGMPDAGALTFVNLLPLRATAPGFGALVSGPAAGAPSASNVNFRPGSVDPNLAVAVTDANGLVCFRNSEHATIDLVADVMMSIAPGAFTPTTTGQPLRLVDTRVGLGGDRIAASEIRCFPSGGTPGDVAIVNLLPLDASAPGFGALGGSGISNVNVAPGSVDPNLAFSAIDAQGRLCYVNSDHGAVDLVADLLATINASATVPPPADVQLPSRLIDTRPPGDPRLSCPTAQRCYRVDGDDAVSVSDDGGLTWFDTSLPGAFALGHVTCVRPERCIVSGGALNTRFGAGYVTLDGGRSWQIPAGFGFPADIECPSARVCLAVGGVFLFLGNTRPSASITLDGGATWTAIPFDDIPLDVLNAHLGALSCSAAECLAQFTRSDRPVPSNVTFSSNDGWQSVTVTQSDPV